MYEYCYFTWISLFLYLNMNIPILYDLYIHLRLYFICSRCQCSCVQYIDLYVFCQKIKISKFEIKILKITQNPMKTATPPPPGDTTCRNLPHPFQITAFYILDHIYLHSSRVWWMPTLFFWKSEQGRQVNKTTTLKYTRSAGEYIQTTAVYRLSTP